MRQHVPAPLWSVAMRLRGVVAGYGGRACLSMRWGTPAVCDTATRATRRHGRSVWHWSGPAGGKCLRRRERWGTLPEAVRGETPRRTVASCVSLVACQQPPQACRLQRPGLSGPHKLFVTINMAANTTKQAPFVFYGTAHRFRSEFYASLKLSALLSRRGCAKHPYLAKGAAVINVAPCATVYFGKMWQSGTVWAENWLPGSLCLYRDRKTAIAEF